MLIDDLKKRKQELGYSNEKVAELSGVPLGTVQKIFGGATKHPRYRTLQAIQAVLFRDSPEKKETQQGYPAPSSDYMMIREPQAAYEASSQPQPSYGTKRQGEYTLEDYYALPDDARAELIDGVLYDMAAPAFIHQDILLNLGVQLKLCMQEHPCGCRLFLAPIDVQLDCDERTIVQPDIIVFCDDGKMRRRVYFGAPDFVVEILSPSTRKKDVTVKLRKYIGAGVREYWIVDPDTERVFVYQIEEGELPFICGYGEKVPVGISGGACSIDFTAIWDSARELRDLEE
jgi:Uma2 family endonuclease